MAGVMFYGYNLWHENLDTLWNNQDERWLILKSEYTVGYLLSGKFTNFRWVGCVLPRQDGTLDLCIVIPWCKTVVRVAHTSADVQWEKTKIAVMAFPPIVRSKLIVYVNSCLIVGFWVWQESGLSELNSHHLITTIYFFSQTVANQNTDRFCFCL